MLQDLTDVVQKQAERRIRSRNIMYVPDIHDSALKNTHSDRRYGESEEKQELKLARDYIYSSHTLAASPDLAAHVVSNTALDTENEHRATECCETKQ